MTSLKEANKQRELMDYEFHHLYSRAKFGTTYSIVPTSQPIREPRAGADPAQYGVLVVGEDGTRRLYRASHEICLREATAKGGMVLRLGTNSLRSKGERAPTTGRHAPLPKALVDESGNIEWVEIERSDVPSSLTISADLEELGYERAIQYNSTRPTAAQLFSLHKRHQDITMDDFAVAVVKHFEPLGPPKKAGIRPQILSRTEREKEGWYLTPAGQQWLKEHSIPPIMRHTKKEFSGWKNPEQSRL